MTRSFGGPGGRPEDRRPLGRGTGRGPSPGSGRDRQADQEQAQEPAKIEIGKRLVALIIDFFCCYLVGAVVAMIPFINTFLPLPSVMIIVFLCRDAFFDGHGIGKNLMGLQVIDIRSGQPCNLLQSVQRNVVLVAPYVVLTLVDLVLRFVPLPWVNEYIRGAINALGMVYCLVVMPIEAHRAYTREDGLRIGDDIAGTAIIESPMDFSQPMPRL
jgi:uncharacterized RDD family membrane protein YckC